MDIINTPQTAVKVASLTHSLGKPIIFAESYGCLEGGVAARSKMNQTAISHNWTSKSSELNSDTLELWGFYFMSQFQLKTPLSSPVNWENRGYSVTYAGRFICDFQRSPQDFYFCHSPSRGEWEQDRVELTKIQSSRWLSQCHSTVTSVTVEWLSDSEWVNDESRTISFVSALTSYGWLPSLEIKAPRSLLDAICQSFSTVDTAYYLFDGYWFQVKTLFSKVLTLTPAKECEWNPLPYS